ncbi:hypothetical protein L7F22_053288 [Adiantum nelumboides]|nr:hypothetical protein [Adiantum nelumboides]
MGERSWFWDWIVDVLPSLESWIVGGDCNNVETFEDWQAAQDDDEADTVGCCSLKVEHVTLVPPRSLQFDFLGKDSIRYFNTVEVVEQVYRAIGDFKKSKKLGEDLFDKLDTSKLNAHLKDIMPHLTAKVFRTYNASITLDRLLVDTDGQIVQEKIVSYQKANKERKQPKVEELDEILVPEQILAHMERKVRGKVARRYLVKFRKYSPMDAKWMEEAELVDSPQLLQLYLEAFQLQPTVT